MHLEHRMDDLPTPVRHTAHGNLPESCRISSPSPEAMNFVLVMFTWRPFDKLSWTRRGSNSRPPDWGNSASCQLSSTYASRHWNRAKKRNSNDMPVAALDNWQPVWNAQVSISTPVCVNFELRPGAGDIHICWFNFDALAQGNAYKPTKEPINYRGPGGDRTHDLQTEATPPAASCPARTLHATDESNLF